MIAARPLTDSIPAKWVVRSILFSIAAFFARLVGRGGGQ